MDSNPNNPTPKRFAPRREMPKDELEISSGAAVDSETILASSSDGESLTLLEEYALRERKSYTTSFILALIYASVSLYFLWLLFQKSNYHV